MVISLDAAKDAMRRRASAAVTEHLSRSLTEYKKLYDNAKTNPTGRNTTVFITLLNCTKEAVDARLDALLDNFKEMEDVIDQTIVDSKDVTSIVKFYSHLCQILANYVYDEKKSFSTLIDSMESTFNKSTIDNVNKYRNTVNRRALLVLGSISYYELV